ncbi:protease pro-enzyme activation domain-containing protein [Burkholderia sp. 22PA0099]|uniref:protease pro-enzyme activation domain-containing protein n=1 Tax=Burkholderia sp. 22PA0099 TaxID=3237372 RepID=UPI0039C474D3
MKIKKFPLRVVQMAALVMLPVFAHADQSVAAVYNSTSQTLRFPAEHNLSMREELAFAHGAEPKSADTFPIIFPLKLRNKAQFDELINALTSDSGYGKPRHLSVEEFRSIYAPSDDQVRRVVDYLNRHGFTRIEVAPNRLFVSARGNSSSIQSAFQTGMHVFAMDDGRSVHANTSAALLPPSISSIVDGVIGLDNVTLLHTNGRRSPNPINDSVPSPAELRRSAETAGAIPSVTGHWPSDFVGIYHAGKLPSGADTTVGVICAGDNIQQVVSDLSAYTNLSDLPPSTRRSSRPARFGRTMTATTISMNTPWTAKPLSASPAV